MEVRFHSKMVSTTPQNHYLRGLMGDTALQNWKDILLATKANRNRINRPFGLPLLGSTMFSGPSLVKTPVMCRFGLRAAEWL